MTRGRAAVLAAAVVIWSESAGAQVTDSTPPIRHILAIDYSRIKPFHRVYDIVVTSPDSTIFIGKRDVALSESVLADSALAWTLVESRSGSVVSVDTLTLTADLRPLRWTSVVGGASLEVTFTLDTMAARIRMGAAGARFTSAIPPDLIPSDASLDVLASVLPLDTAWSDVATILEMDLTRIRLLPAELSVTGEDSVAVTPGLPARKSVILTLRTGAAESRLWVDRETFEVLRTQQMLASPVGSVLEYRIRPPQLSTAP